MKHWWYGIDASGFGWTVCYGVVHSIREVSRRALGVETVQHILRRKYQILEISCVDGKERTFWKASSLQRQSLLSPQLLTYTEFSLHTGKQSANVSLY